MSPSWNQRRAMPGGDDHDVPRRRFGRRLALAVDHADAQLARAEQRVRDGTDRERLARAGARDDPEAAADGIALPGAAAPPRRGTRRRARSAPSPCVAPERRLDVQPERQLDRFAGGARRRDDDQPPRRGPSPRTRRGRAGGTGRERGGGFRSVDCRWLYGRRLGPLSEVGRIAGIVELTGCTPPAAGRSTLVAAASVRRASAIRSAGPAEVSIARERRPCSSAAVPSAGFARLCSPEDDARVVRTILDRGRAVRRRGLLADRHVLEPHAAKPGRRTRRLRHAAGGLRLPCARLLRRSAGARRAKPVSRQGRAPEPTNGTPRPPRCFSGRRRQ